MSHIRVPNARNARRMETRRIRPYRRGAADGPVDPIVGIVGGITSEFERDGTLFQQVIFRNNGSFRLSKNTVLSYALVGGGASGGSHPNTGSGGGGAGWADVKDDISFPSGTYTFTRGTGGGAVVTSNPGFAGTASNLTGPLTLTAPGGGGGGADVNPANTAGKPGGCGGGSAGHYVNGLDPTYPGGSGDPGGDGGTGWGDVTLSSSRAGGGGGGAGGNGSDGATVTGGEGGPGINVPFMEPPTTVARGGRGTTMAGQASPAEIDGNGSNANSATNGPVGRGGNGLLVLVAVKAVPGPITDIVGGAITRFTRDGKKLIQIIFGASGSFTVGARPVIADVAIVGGGGSGGAHSTNGSGGGGGGAVSLNPGVTLTEGVYNFTCGVGALGVAPSRRGLNGGTSTLAGPLALTAIGGGSGGCAIDSAQAVGAAGGCGGGGGGGTSSNWAGGAGSPGFNGGLGWSDGSVAANRAGGGGGGMGGVGGTAAAGVVGAGGPGIAIPFAEPVLTVAKGGGGSKSGMVGPPAAEVNGNGSTAGTGSSSGKAGDGLLLIVVPEEALAPIGGKVRTFTRDGRKYRQTTFAASGLFTVPALTNAYIGVVAGGGTGGGTNGTGTRAGGGGGGEVLLTDLAPLDPGVYTVMVGHGGNPALGAGAGNNRQGVSGQDSSFVGGALSLVAKGGGGGGGNTLSCVPLPGGSGGGSAASGGLSPPGGTATGSGGVGGNSYTDGIDLAGGGGGGAGGAGHDAFGGNGGVGGPGKLIDFMEPPTRCGGGGGAAGSFAAGNGVDGGTEGNPSSTSKAINGGGSGGKTFSPSYKGGDGFVVIVEDLGAA